MQASVIFDGPQKGSSRTGISFNCHCSKMGAKTNLRLTWWFEVANHSHSTAFIYSVSFLRTCSIVLRSDKCWLQAEPTFTSNIFLNLEQSLYVFSLELWFFFFCILMQYCRRKYLFLLLGPPWTRCSCQFFFSTHSNTQIIIFSDMEWGREQ